MSYASHLGSIPQSEPLPGQVANSGGGFSFAVDDWKRLDRFLILGAVGGSYYAGERELTIENAAVVTRCGDVDWRRTVNQIVAVSESGRAPKNEPAIMALAVVAKKCFHANGRAYALANLSKVCRIGTHLFAFAEYVKALGGWGRGSRRAVSKWYLDRDPEKLALQAIKYQQRNGWSHKDILRKAHPKTNDATCNAILSWMVKGWDAAGQCPHPDPVLRRIWAFERAKVAGGKELLELVELYGLPHECVPNEAKNDPKVWDAMLPHMGLTAMIRNLGKMTSVGLLTPLSAAERLVVDTLKDVERLRAARVHPLAILVALKIYAQGNGDKGSLAWSPSHRIVDALDAAFYLAFKAVEPTGKRYMLGLDVSTSMCSPYLAGMPGITPRVGSAAMAMVTANVEQETVFVGYSHQLVRLDISSRKRLDDVVQYIGRVPFGATDCALPILWAAQDKIPVDVFVSYTDSETNVGSVHPKVALDRYRQRTGIGAKLAVCAMTSNGFTIADPDDPGQLDLVGFDTSTPAVLNEFVRG